MAFEIDVQVNLAVEPVCLAEISCGDSGRAAVHTGAGNGPCGGLDGGEVGAGVLVGPGVEVGPGVGVASGVGVIAGVSVGVILGVVVGITVGVVVGLGVVVGFGV